MTQKCTDGKGSQIFIADSPYNNPKHKLNVFGQVYTKNAHVYLYKDLAKVVEKAAKLAKKDGYTMQIMDGLRVIEAQKNMEDYKNKKNLPDELVSSPGGGGHPRGMAVDLILLDQNHKSVDMGTPFDYFDPKDNKAYRGYKGLTKEQKENRKKLDSYVFKAAKELGIEVIGLKSEWWDYRFPSKIYEKYKPISDRDLPENMRMTPEGRKRQFVSIKTKNWEKYIESKEEPNTKTQGIGN